MDAKDKDTAAKNIRKRKTHPEYFLSQTEMADVLQVDNSTIRNWITKAGFPIRDKTGWKKELVLKWVAEHNKPTPLKDRKTELECEKLQVIIKRELEGLEQDKIETLKKREKLVDITEVNQHIVKMHQSILNALSTWQISETTKQPANKKIIDSLVWQLKEHMSNNMKGI